MVVSPLISSYCCPVCVNCRHSTIRACIVVLAQLLLMLLFSGFAVVTDPEDPRFDLEKLIAKWEAESK